MMRTKLFSICALAAVLSLASCSQDEPAEQGTTLPDGMYPMTFSVVQAAPESTPQTRVTESGNGMSSQWTNNDRIKITVSGPGNNMEAEMLRINGVFIPDRDLYWQNTNDATVNAWYSNIEGQSTMPPYDYYTVSLADQSGGLAYVLKTDPIPANYQTGNIVLNFYHQLAKIRVKLEKDSYEGDLSNATVKVKGHTSCIVKNGEVSEGSGEGYITMHKNGDWYEANLVPNTLQASEAFEISAGDKTTKASLKGDVSLEKGKVHEITINVKQSWPDEVDSGTYTISGESSKTVKLSGNATLILDGAVSRGAETAIRVTGGSPTIVVKGTENNFQCSKTPILLDPDASVTIKGNTDNAKDSKLIVQAGDFCTGIGAAPGSDGNNIPAACGNITIENITLHANGSFGSGNKAGAGIGTPGGYAGSCGDITIKNSTVHARGGQGAAAIGTGCNVYRDVSCGKITIDHSQIYATVDYFYAIDYLNGYAAGIGHGAWLGNSITGTVGEIVITTDEEEDEFFSSDRFKRADGGTTGFYKVGKGTCTSDVGTQVWSGATFNGKSLATKDDNGYPKNL